MKTKEEEYIQQYNKSTELIDKLWSTLLQKQQLINRQLEESEKKYNLRMEENNRITQESEKKLFKRLEVNNLQIKEYLKNTENEQEENEDDNGVNKKDGKRLKNKKKNKKTRYIQKERVSKLIIIEEISNPDKADIEQHINRIKYLKGQMEEIGDDCELQGAIAGSQFSADEQKMIQEASLIILEQFGNDYIKRTSV